MGRGVVVADRAQHQPLLGAVEEVPEADDQRDREVDEGVLAEDHAPEQRNVGDVRNIEMRGAVDLLSDVARTDQPREADAEDGQRETGRDLIGCKPERQRREDRRERHAAENAAQRADSDRAGVVGARKAAGGADDHHALDAEIQNAGALDDQFAGRRKQQRRRGGDHGEQDGFNELHGQPSARTRGGSGRE